MCPTNIHFLDPFPFRVVRVFRGYNPFPVLSFSPSSRRPPGLKWLSAKVFQPKTDIFHFLT